MSELSKNLHLEMSKVIFGPVPSRRFGVSLGINPLPTNKKSCSFNCVYCQLGRTDNPLYDPSLLRGYPSSEDIILEFEKKLDDENFPKIDVITFSGNGEPTLNPELKEIIRGIKKARDERKLQVPILILTNSSLLYQHTILESLKLFDKVVAKLDTVDQNCFLEINRPVEEMKIDNIVNGLKCLHREIGDKLILQIMVIDSLNKKYALNNRVKDLTKLAEIVSEISPADIQIYSLDRKPAEQGIVKVNYDLLSWIASMIEEKVGKKRLKIY